MAFEPDYSRVFFSNQITAAKDIVDTFETSHRLFNQGVVPDESNSLPFYALLWAQVQSGKSGTFHCIARMMYWKGLIDHVYILCGSSETNLRNQAISDTRRYQEDIIDDFKVIFRQDFSKHMPLSENTLNLERALIIIDESHMDQDNNQQLSTLLSAYGLSLAGTLPSMRHNSTFILSVDATPYAEIAAVTSHLALPKHICKMVPGDGYIGPIQLYESHHLHNAPSIDYYNFSHIADTIRKYADGKYAIFRTRGNKTKILIQICKTFKFDIRFYTMNRNTIVVTDEEKTSTIRQSLQDKPDNTTVVIISGRLRAGKVLPKQHIGLLWESAPKSNTDVLIQGLWGRACGYYSSSPPHIFLPLNRLIATGEIDRYYSCHGEPRFPGNPSLSRLDGASTPDCPRSPLHSGEPRFPGNPSLAIPLLAANIKKSKDNLPSIRLKSAFTRGTKVPL